MQGRRMLPALLLLGLCSLATSADYRISLTDDGFQLIIEGQTVIQHSQDTAAVLVGKGRTTFFEHLGNFDIEDNTEEKLPLSSFAVDGDTITMSSDKCEVELMVSSGQDKPVTLHVTVTKGSPERMWFRLHAEADEHVYGGGAQASYLDLRGRVYPMWTREQGVGRNKSEEVTFLADTRFGGAGGDYYTSYHSEPTFVTSRRVLFQMLDTHYSVLYLTQPDYHELMVLGVPRQLTLDSAFTWPSFMKRVSSDLGTQPQLPDWVHKGVTIGVQGGTEMMLKRLQTAQDGGVPVTGIWIQDWAGNITTILGKRLYWNWVWDQKLYHDLDKEIVNLKNQGIRILVYINMHVIVNGSLYNEADKQGFLVKNLKGQSYQQDFGEFLCGTVDLTNPDAFNWYKGVITKNILDLGISGWMADFGEYLPTEGVQMHSGSAAEAHNAYPTLWARLNREAVEEAGKLGDVVFFTRSGYSGAGNYTTLMWHGDQNVDWTRADGVASTVHCALNLAMSGVWLSHFDVGGYTTFPPMVRSPELLLRSAEYAAFTPYFRSHEGNMPDVNAQFWSSPEVLSGFATAAQVFAKLEPYRRDVVSQAVAGEMPAQRHLFLHYPQDPESFTAQHQYLYGSDLLIAPVYEANQTEWSIFLPSDVWVHLWSGNEYTGPAHPVVPAPVGKPPVFYRKDSTYAGLFEKLLNTTASRHGEL